MAPSKCTDVDRQVMAKGHEELVSSGCAACLKAATEQLEETCANICVVLDDVERLKKCSECQKELQSKRRTCLP
jgi:hypothetical protein